MNTEQIEDGIVETASSTETEAVTLKELSMEPPIDCSKNAHIMHPFQRESQKLSRFDF